MRDALVRESSFSFIPLDHYSRRVMRRERKPRLSFPISYSKRIKWVYTVIASDSALAGERGNLSP